MTPYKMVVNCKTGKQTRKKLTKAEIARRKAKWEKSEAKRIEREKATAEKAARKAFTLEKLAVAVGLSEDELAELLYYP